MIRFYFINESFCKYGSCELVKMPKSAGTTDKVTRKAPCSDISAVSAFASFDVM